MSNNALKILDALGDLKDLINACERLASSVEDMTQVGDDYAEVQAYIAARTASHEKAIKMVAELEDMVSCDVPMVPMGNFRDLMKTEVRQ